MPSLPAKKKSKKVEKSTKKGHPPGCPFYILCLGHCHGLVDKFPVEGIVNHAEVGLDSDFLPVLADNVVGQFVDIASFCLSRKFLQPDFNPVHVPRDHNMTGLGIDRCLGQAGAKRPGHQFGRLQGPVFLGPFVIQLASIRHTGNDRG